jgi:flagellar biosynthesis chaperone FliJ
MNKARRKQLSEVSDKLNAIMEELQSIMDDEEEYRDNIPENLVNSERYEKADNACTEIQTAIDQLEDVIASVDSAQE